MKKLPLLLSMLFVVTGLATAETSFAGDKKVLPASACHPWGGNPAGTSDNLVYSQFGRVENNHPTLRLGVVCPIPRDETNGAPSHLRVYINDRNDSGNSNGIFQCVVRSNNVWGQTSTDFELFESDDSGVGSNSWTFFGIDSTSNGGQFNESNYTLHCKIPPADNTGTSFLGSYAIIEGSGTHND